MNKVPLKLEDMFGKEINILMLPPRSEDWGDYAVSIAKQFSSAKVFYGRRNNNESNKSNLLNWINDIEKLNKECSELKITEESISLIRPKSLTSKLQLSLHSELKKRVFPFKLGSSHREKLPFKLETFDLAITQTPSGSDVMLHLAYGMPAKPRQLFSVMKSNSYWIHITSSLDLKNISYSYFNLLNEGEPNIFENKILRSIFGKNGSRLNLRDINRIKKNPILGEILSGPNNWMLYQRLQEIREPMQKIE